MARPKPGFADAAVADAKKSKPSEDSLKMVRGHIRTVRDLSLEIADLEEKTARLKTERHDLLNKKLPDMFTQLGINTLGIDAEGNLPPFEARSGTYYKANIAADWPDDKRKKSFEWLRKNKLGDIIKTQFEIELGRGTEKQQRELKKFLKKAKIPFDAYEGVSHSTLTAVFKSMVEKEKKTPPLDILGASMGTVVQVKEVKPKTTANRS